MTWLKYHNEPIVLDDLHHRWQSEPLSQYGKPHGFWITDDSDQCWRSWCVGEDYGRSRLTHVHEVALDESRILFLRAAHELDDFTRQYAIERPWETINYRGIDRLINWPAVADRYAGIIITPYQWSLRLSDHCRWYYSWDCASGCIWDVSAILSVHLREIVPPPPARSYDDEQEEAA